MLKKIMILLSVVTISISSYACPNKQVHDATQDLAKNKLITITKSKVVINVQKSSMAAVIASGGDASKAEELVQLMIIGVLTYANNHNLEVELNEN